MIALCFTAGPLKSNAYKSSSLKTHAVFKVPLRRRWHRCPAIVPASRVREPPLRAVEEHGDEVSGGQIRRQERLVEEEAPQLAEADGPGLVHGIVVVGVAVALAPREVVTVLANGAVVAVDGREVLHGGDGGQGDLVAGDDDPAVDGASVPIRCMLRIGGSGRGASYARFSASL